ncbi:MAG: SCO1664 family protein [Anaerolineales bacterium]|nr:SCO1664 family protein [Anaerolineales bacterium]MCS7246974.1 SCO1664 family protein [Anaerolineales bacterium]MDW8160785.1 SCO1664 family protein [Anaerolineales bacterium]MDW8447623.1 SCO1664 family protein [Anaerolineales bacterium]
MGFSLDHAHLLHVLQVGEIRLEGEFLWGSNSTFYVSVYMGGKVWKAVYKPVRGERPLWDFPPRTLAKRETAAYIVSQALGWELVPPTVFRSGAPFGAGSVQLYIEHDPEYHYFTFTQRDRERLRPVVTFDLVVNNADRKGSHVLVDRHGHIWCIDHGICFHEQEKLRTVLWDFAGEPIPEELVEDLRRVSEDLKRGTEWVAQLGTYLSLAEISAFQRRVEALIRKPVFPSPPEERRPYPWPPI